MEKLSNNQVIALLEKCVKIKKYKSKISLIKKEINYYRTSSLFNEERIYKLENQLIILKNKLRIIK